MFGGESIYCNSFVTTNPEISIKDNPDTEKKTGKLNLGLNIGGSGLKLNLNLKPQIGKGPPIKLGLSGLKSQANPQTYDDLSSKNYEKSLSQFVKLHHRSNNPLNQVSIHKIII